MSGVPFALLAIDHVVLRSAEPARLANFYCEVLGCTKERHQEAIGLMQLRAGGALVDIIDIHGPQDHGGAAPVALQQNMDHFCLSIAPFDETSLRVHLLAHGVTASSTMQRFGAEGLGPSIYLTDPDGNTVELKGPCHPG
jgi:catechol 2,3-dioxygenase-like lactoylglutathione lyase family enzyme